MNNFTALTSSSFLENPSPEVDRGIALASIPESHNLVPVDSCPYGYKMVLKLKSKIDKHGDLYELVAVKDPRVHTCDTRAVSASKDRAMVIKNKLKRTKTIKNKKIQKKSVCVYDIDIREEGGLINSHLSHMISNAKLVQRLSDNDVGGGLGKKKRLNRMIAQGSTFRYSGAKKKCPIALEERNDRKSSQAAHSSNLRKSRDAKYIVEQSAPIEVPDYVADAIRRTDEIISNPFVSDEDKTQMLGEIHGTTHDQNLALLSSLSPQQLKEMLHFMIAHFVHSEPKLENGDYIIGGMITVLKSIYGFMIVEDILLEYQCPKCQQYPLAGVNKTIHCCDSICEQAFGFGVPSVPVEAGPETISVVEDFVSALKDKKVDLSDDVKATFSQLTDAISGISNAKVTHGFDFMSLVPKSLTGKPMQTFWIVGLLCIAFASCYNRMLLKSMITLSGVAVFLTEDWCSYAKQHYDNIMEWARERASSCNVEITDAKEVKEEGLTSGIVDSMIAFIYYTHAKSCKWEKDPMNKLASFFHRTKDMRKTKEGVEFTFSGLLSYIQVFLDWLSETFGFSKFNICMDNRPEITLYAEKVTICLKAFTEGRILNCESAKEVLELFSEGNKLAKALPASPEYAESRKLIQATVSELTPLILRIRRSNLHNNGPRIQPVGVFLTGPPGVGKTTAIIPLMLDVTGRTIPDDMVSSFRANHNDFIYNRISENEYYDSYNGQYNVLFDDLGLTRDVKGVTSNPYMEFVRMVNSNSMDLHMAHLDDKGTTSLRSKFVWATSNIPKFNLESLINNGALTRRFTCSYLVVPAPGYRVDENEPDPWKMKLKCIPFEPGFPHLQFFEYDALEGRVTCPTPMTLREVSSRIIMAHDFTQKFGLRTLQLHEEFKAQALAMRDPNYAADAKEEAFTGNAPSYPAMLEHETIGEYVCRIRDETRLQFKMHVVSECKEKVIDNLDVISECLESKTKIQLLIDKYKSYAYTAYCKLYDVASTISFVSTMKTMLSGLAIFTSGYGLFKLLQPGDAQDESGDYAHQKSMRASRANSKKTSFKPSFIRQNWSGRSSAVEKQEELAYDATCDDILYKVFKKNVYTLHQTHTSDRMGCITFIGGHDAVMPRHFAENIYSKIHDGVLAKDTTVILRSASNPLLPFEVKFTDIQFFFTDEWDNEDICFATFPNVLPQSPNIRKYFLEDSEVFTKSFSGKMMVPKEDGSLIIPFTKMEPMSSLAYTNYVNPGAFSYCIPTKEGYCGNLIFVSNPLTGVGKIIGQHTAGTVIQGEGFASRILKSQIDLFDSFRKGKVAVVNEEGAFDSKFTTEKVEPATFKTLFKSDPAKPPLTTSIVPSPLHNVVRESKCAPAKLRKFVNEQGVEVDPWLNARAKYAKPVPYINSEVLDICARSYGSTISNKSTDDAPWSKKIFTFEEAVRGVPGVPNCEGVPRNTSSGYPFCLEVPKGHKGKSHFFGSDDEYEFTSHHCVELRNRVYHIVNEASKGNRLQHIYFDFLKDERRLLEKVIAGSTRLVSASPVDLLIATRMYFMDFVRWFMSNRIINGSAVGVNPFSSEWESIRKCLRGAKLDKNLIAGDFKAYDACLVRQIQICFLNFVNSWYDDGNDLIRTVLFEDVCNSKHIFNDLVYEWPGGNPSGCFLTTILNTFCNNVIMRYAGILSHDEIQYGPGMHIVSSLHQVSSILQVMERTVFFLAYGDDNIISVGEPLRGWFNQTTLTRAFAKIGFTYTSEDKSEGGVESLRSIDEVSFLKRSWKYDPIVNTYVAALDLDTVLEMVQWTKKNDKDFNFVKTNVDTSLKELSAHGDVIWDKWSAKICSAAKDKLSYMTPIVNRRHALSLQLSRDDMNC
jgi:hypothetical protein